jgi:hypothetical protein
MLLQHVAASFHIPSVRTANINTVQYTKPHKRYEIPTIPSAVICKVLLPLSNIKADFVHNHNGLLFDVSSGLPTYKNHITHFTTSIAAVVVVVVVVVLLLLRTNSNLVLKK